MELHAHLVHAESGCRVVAVSARLGELCLGTALGEGATAEEAEDRARQRLLLQLGSGASSSRPGAAAEAGVRAAALLPQRPRSQTDGLLASAAAGSLSSGGLTGGSSGGSAATGSPAGRVAAARSSTTGSIWAAADATNSAVAGAQPPEASPPGAPPRGLHAAGRHPKAADPRAATPNGAAPLGGDQPLPSPGPRVIHTRRSGRGGISASDSSTAVKAESDPGAAALSQPSGPAAPWSSEAPEPGASGDLGPRQPWQEASAAASHAGSGSNSQLAPLSDSPAQGTPLAQEALQGDPAAAQEADQIPADLELNNPAATPTHTSAPPLEPALPLPEEDPGEEPPADPEDWSGELAAVDLQLRRLGWNREQESLYLQRVFGHPSRSRLTRYSDLVAYLTALEALAPGSDPALAAVPLRRVELLAQGDALLTSLGWSAEQGRRFLEQQLQCSHRRQLNDTQLLAFNMLLEEQLLAAGPQSSAGARCGGQAASESLSPPPS